MIQFGNLHTQYTTIQSEIDAAIQEVLDSGRFILGQQLEQFEQEFAAYCGAQYAVGVGSGTEALHLALVASGITPGDQVVTVPNTAVPTISAITFAQAIPRFVDIDPDTCLMDIDLLAQFLDAEIRHKGNMRIKALMPVHLYGQCVDMAPLLELARQYRLPVIEDAAQAHGALYNGQKAGTLGDIACFSFYPSKNLGAYGDAGMLVTNDEVMSKQLKLLRNYGQETRYQHTITGFNSRLDEMQAAILRAKLPHLDAWNDTRRQHAKQYTSALASTEIHPPVEAAYGRHVYHLYVIRCKQRDQLQQYLLDHGIQTFIHYPIPVHRQKAYADLQLSEGSFPVAEQTVREILSLPIYPELSPSHIQEVCACLNDFCQKYLFS
jgi:dTDP-4-amino-4,6-dideoxygalactose transaminase